MSEFNLQNAIPVTQENGQEIRSAPFSLDNAVPERETLVPEESAASKAEGMAIPALQSVQKVASVIRWPFARFIEHPVSTLVTAMQEPEGKTIGGTLGKAAEAFEPKAIPPQDYGTYGQIWNNYYRSIMKTDAPDWYKWMASYGTAMGVEPPIIRAAEAGAEMGLTRVATEEEANTIRGSFQPIKDSLSKVGIDAKDLHAEGNIISLSDESELYLNNRVSAVLRGDEIRVPRWATINLQEALPSPEALPNNYLDNLPLTGKSIIPAPPKISAPDLTSEAGQVTMPPVDEFIQKSTETLPVTHDLQQGFTQLKTQAQADDLRAQQLLKKITLTPQDAEALYHHQENPQEPLTEAQQKIYDETIKPLADKSAELFAKLRNDGVPIPSEGYTPRFIEGKGNIFDRLKSNINIPLRPESIEKTGASPINAPGKGWTANRGAMPGEAFAWLGENEETAKAAIMEKIDDEGNVLYESVDNKGQSLGIFPTIKEAKISAEQRTQASAKGGVKNVGSGISGLLKKTSGSFKTRTMKALTDENGKRVVVSIKKGEVVAYRKGEKPQPLGKVNSKELGELLAKETAPLEKHIKDLEKEEKILRVTKSRTEAAIKRLQNIEEDLMQTQLQIMNKNWEYNPENFEMKVFVDKNGKRWTVGEATTREIEGNTDLTYHKNALLNNLIHYNELQKIDRATQWLESIKNDPEFQKFSMKSGTGNPPADWKMTHLPQFRGYYLEPRIADTFDYFNKQLYKGRDPLAVFTAMNRFLRTAIFFNPLIHVPNIAAHWITNRGVSGLSPTTWGRLAKTSGRAIQAVFHQNKDYLDMLDSGVNLMYHNQSGETLADLMLQKMGQELRGNDKLLQKMKGLLGNINPYNISGKVTWAFNDLATLQSIYENEEKGMTKQESIDETAKHIPNYILPARIMNSRFISEIMTNPNVTMFGAYHYGALKSYGEMAKSLLGKVPLKDRADAADKIAMLGLLLFAIYPLMDKILQQATGNKNAHIRRAGSTTLPENIIKLEKGQIDFAQLIQSVITPAVGAKEALELGFNRDLFTGQKVYHEGMEAEGIGKLAIESIAPLNAITRITDKKISLKDYLLSMAGISMTDPNKGKLYAMKDAKAEFQKDFDKMYAENPEKALKAVKKFNDKQIKDLQDVVKEEGLKELPKSVVNEFIVTSTGGEKQPKKTAGEMLQKPKRQKRKHFSIREVE